MASNTDDKPKSIRLNQGHRDDIINAVMAQWKKHNPPPKNATMADLVRAIFKRYSKPRRNAPEEFKQLARIIQRGKDTMQAMKSLSVEAKKLLNLKTEKDWQFIVRNPQRNPGEGERHIITKIPVPLAMELGLPVAEVGHTYGNHAHWSAYVEEGADGPRIPCAGIPYQGSYITVVIEEDLPELAAYDEGRKARNEWDKERQRMARETRDYLNQFNTTGQIRDQWPELEPYLPAHIADPSRVIQLPAIAKSRLNERLGL